MSRKSFVVLLVVTGVLVSAAPFAHAQTAKKQGKNAKTKKAAKKESAKAEKKDAKENKETELPDRLEWVAAKRRGPNVVNLPLLGPATGAQELNAEQLDLLIAEELIAEGLESSSKRIQPDQFVRRIYLDVLGRLPKPEEVDQYLNDPSPERKAALVDRLLADPGYGRNLARYWRDAIIVRSAEPPRLSPDDFENWLAGQFNKNERWANIVGSMLTATGDTESRPETFFIVSQNADPVQLAGETARLFLGVQIQCAECHDHPLDVWKREQFHELAAFFSKVRTRKQQDKNVFEVMSRKGDYNMPDLQNPSSKGTKMEPVFLTGQPVEATLPDDQLRLGAARLLTSKRNEYFAKAFVNRVWAELMGYGFTNPVDNLGREVAVAYPKVWERLALSFRNSNFDVKQLYRAILNSKTYERRFKEIDGSFGQDVMFATIQPTRLSADQIYDALETALGDFAEKGRGTLRNEFRRYFEMDPSANQEDLEGSILQALLLMNSGRINGRINASAKGNLLARLLKEKGMEEDEKVIEALYLHVLARKPLASEVASCKDYIAFVKNRSEALEDILWSLINSAEFLYNH